MKIFKYHLHELFYFGLKQAYACLFGGFLLAIMLITHFWYPLEGLHRYDFIFLSAIAFQVLMVVLRLETRRELMVIAIFHVVATVMELFKTSDSIGSWHYPEAYFFGIANVPLFTGFMYSAVGSYLARVWRLFDFEYRNYPKKLYTLLLVIVIYINFFSHHFILDLRWWLLAVTVMLFYKTTVHFRIIKTQRYMPLLLGWLLVALFIWFAENLATYSRIWFYPNQANGWQMVPLAKLSSWYLLMLLSFVLLTLINTIEIHEPTDQSKHDI